MNSFNAVQRVNIALDGLSRFVKSQNLQGNTGLAVYVENFMSKIFEILYDYPFENLNKQKINISGIDLYSSEKEHAIQITTKDINFSKIENSLKKLPQDYSYKKVAVFFFLPTEITGDIKNKTANYKKQNNLQYNVEVISIKNIIDIITTEAGKAFQINEICELWINGRNNNYPDIIAKFNAEANKKIEANKNSRKYIPDVYVQENNFKLSCRFFCDDNFLSQWVKIKYGSRLVKHKLY